LKKRIVKFEIAMTPKQLVLLSLKEAQKFPAFEQYLESNAGKPLAAVLRVLVSNRVTEAVQAAARRKLLSVEAANQLVAESKNQADFLVLLAYNINARLLEEADHIWESLELIDERHRRMGREFHLHKRFDEQEWIAWRKKLVELLSRLLALKAALAELGKTYFDGHEILFQKQRDKLNSQIEVAESIAKLYNDFEREVPSWAAIELEIGDDSIRSEMSRLVREFVTIARAVALRSNGQVLAARQLMQANLAQ